MGRPPVGSTGLMVKVPPPLLDAIDRFIAEERPGTSRPDALRFLAAEHLKTLGILEVRDAG